MRRSIISTAQRRVWHFNCARVHTLWAYLKCRTITAQKCHIAPETCNISLTCSHCTSLVHHSITTRSRIHRFITKSRDGSPPQGSSGKCSNAANIGERKTWTQSVFCTWQWQNSVRGQESQKCIYSVSASRRPASYKVWLTSVERRRCSIAKPRRETR